MSIHSIYICPHRKDTFRLCCSEKHLARGHHCLNEQTFFYIARRDSSTVISLVSEHVYVRNKSCPFSDNQKGLILSLVT